MIRDIILLRILLRRFLWKLWRNFRNINWRVFKKYLPGFRRLNKSINMILASINHSMKILKMCSRSFWEVWRSIGKDNKQYWMKKIVIWKLLLLRKHNSWNKKWTRLTKTQDNYNQKPTALNSKTANSNL